MPSKIMKWIWVGLVFLMACAQPLEPVIAPAVTVVFDGCESANEIGEQCKEDCECLKPGICLDGICSLTKQEDGQLCVDNKQCLSGYCTENNVCGGPDGPTGGFDCDRVCRDDYPSLERKCYTVCKHR